MSNSLRFYKNIQSFFVFNYYFDKKYIVHTYWKTILILRTYIFTFNVHLTLRNCIITRRREEHLFFNAWTLRRIICFVNFWICVLNIESIQYDRTCICKVVTNMPGLLIRSYYESKISCTRCEMNFELRIILNINFYLLKKMKIFEIFVFLSYLKISYHIFMFLEAFISIYLISEAVVLLRAMTINLFLKNYIQFTF